MKNEQVLNNTWLDTIVISSLVIYREWICTKSQNKFMKEKKKAKEGNESDSQKKENGEI